MNSFTFEGFERATGVAGTRNHLLVLSPTGLTTPLGRRIAGRLRGAIALGTGHGSGLLGEDAAIHAGCLAGMATHPNVGAVLVIGADALRIEPLVEAAEAAGRPVAGLCLDDFGHDALRLGDAALRAAAGLLKTISRQGRTRLPASQLALGLECGRSDPSSGLVANPLVGHMADAVTDAGGTAIFAETTEWLGAEALLTARAASPEIAAAIRNAALRREQRAIAEGMDLTYNNPSLTNIQAGLTTIEEKSLGAIAKSGSRTIEGVLAYGETPPAAGLWAMDAAAYAPESLTGFTAAGCNLALFTTGVGNSYTSALMPTIKLTANPETARRITAQLDFTAEAVFSGDEPMERAARRLIDQIAATASGEMTFGEILSDCDEVIGRYGAAL